MRRLLVVLIIPAALDAQASDSLLAAAARPAVHCAPAQPVKLRTQLDIAGLIEREYDVPDRGEAGRHFRVAYDSGGRLRRFFAVRTHAMGMQTLFAQGDGDSLNLGFRTDAFLDSTRLGRVAVPTQEQVREAVTTRTTIMTADDRAAAMRLAASLWSMPCDSVVPTDRGAFVAAPPAATVDATAPFMVVVVDTMPTLAPPGARATVVRRPGNQPVDVIVIRRDHLSVPALDSMLTTLRVVRMMNPAPDRLAAVGAVAGIAPTDSSAARRTLLELSTAPVREVFGAGRGNAIEVPLLEERSGMMIRRRPPPR